jgi:hypothetical protein
MCLSVIVELLMLILSGVVGLLTAQDWVPHFLLQLLLDVFSLLHFGVSGEERGLSLYQEGMLSLARDLDTLIWCCVGSMLISCTEYFS